MKFDSPKFKSPLLLLMRLGLAATFIWSAVHHLRDPIAFVIKVNEYDILPATLVEPFAVALPWVMVVSSGLLVVGLLTRPAAAAQGMMLLSFIVAVGVNIFRDKVMGCGCFSEEGSKIGWPLVIQDIFLLLLAVILIWQTGGRWSLDDMIYRFINGKKDANHNPSS